MSVMNLNVFSIALKYSIDCTIVLPENINKGEILKCLWLYHGGSGDHTAWLYHTPLVEYVEEKHFAAVLPNVHESCFVNMNIGDSFGSFVGKELPSVIWNMFSCISSKREDNYLAGFSNGGYGCLHTAFMYPNKFAGVGAFSAGDKADADFTQDNSPKAKKRIQLFGDGDLHKNEYGLTYLADKLLADHVERPVIYHACGGKDPWLSMNHMVRDYFYSHKEYNYTYDEIPELGHEWTFWKEELVRYLEFLGFKAN